MSDEIKEILDNLIRYRYSDAKCKQPEDVLTTEDMWILLDYITNLQQAFENSYTEEQLDFAVNEVKEQLKAEHQLTNQLYNEIDKLRVKNYELQQENEYLKMNNPEQNMEHFKIINENKRKINNLREQNIDLKQENERLKREVAKLHIIQEEYGNHIENTHIIDDYQKTYFMSNKWLIELNDGKFVDINILNNNYEDYKSRVEKAIEYNYELQERYCHSALFDELVASKVYEISEKNLNILQGGKDE